MYVAVVRRNRFLAEVRGGKEIPHVRTLRTVTQDDDRRPALRICYEIGARGPSGAAMHLEEIEDR